MKSKLKKLGRWSALPAIALLAALMLYNGILNPGFFKKATFATFLLSSTPLVCVVIGICTCKIVGGIDISLGNLLSLINVTMAVLFTNTELPAAVILLIGLGIGLAGGLLNGICIGILRVNPLLATFATSSVFWGLALWILPTPGGYGVPYAMAKFVNKMVFGVVPMSLLLVALLTIIWLLYMKSVHGVAIYGIGGNEQSAYVSGMDVARSKVLAHLFGGFCAFIGALVTTGLICSGDPNIGAEFGLKAVTAVVIGGVALCGGEGDVWGALAGGYFLSTILIAIISSNVSTFGDGVYPDSQQKTSGGEEGMKNLGKSFYTRYKDYLPALGAIIALGVISTILIDGFMNVNSIGAILLRSSVLAMVAMGVTFVVIAGDSGLDLSTGALMVVGAMIGPNLRVGGEESLILSFLLVFVVGAAIGCINGLGVYFLKIPALVMTMAMNGLVAGYCIMLTHSQLTVNIPKSLADLNTVAFGPIRKMTLLIIILMILLQLFLTKSKFGQMLLLTGNNRQAARLNGIPVALVAIGSYAISGAMAACGGVLLAGYNGIVHIDMTVEYPMQAMAAVIIGGTHSAGGVGSFVGSVMGAVVLTMLNSVLLAFNMAAGARTFIQGLVLLLVLIINNRSAKLRQ